MISTRLLRPLVIGAFAAGLLAASPASAHTAAGTAVGTGTISPGLPPMGCVSGQTVSFDGQVIFPGQNHPNNPYVVHFDGTSSICESACAGQGSGTLSGDITGTVNYSRTCNVVQLTGNVTVDDQPHALTGVCTFAPTSANPTNSYALNCHVVIQ